MKTEEITITGYKGKNPLNGTIFVNESTEGEFLETRVARAMMQNEAITETGFNVYTLRKDGVKPEFDIRTDRFDIAMEMGNRINADNIAKRKLGGAPEKKEESGDPSQ